MPGSALDSLADGADPDDRAPVRHPLRRPALRRRPDGAGDRATSTRSRPTSSSARATSRPTGFKEEYVQARRHLDRIDCESLVVVPGNHDSRNVGYVHFEELFGERNSVLRKGGVTVVAVDSTEPDLDHGQIGRGRYGWIEERVRRRRPSCASSSSTTICCPSRAPAGSATSSTTPATRSSACSARASTSSSPGTSTCRTPGGSRTCSSSTPAPSRRCGCAATRGPVTTSSRSAARTSTSGGATRSTGEERIIQFDLATLEYEKYTARIEHEVTTRRR